MSNIYRPRSRRYVTKTQKIVMRSFLSLPFSKNLKPTLEFRSSQLKIINFLISQRGNPAYIFPAGFGKTVICCLLIDVSWEINRAFSRYPKKFLILVPTLDLADQFLDDLIFFRQFKDNQIVSLAGLSANKRRRLYLDETQVYISTPQGILNDFKKGILSKNYFDYIIVDESHHAVKKYDYTQIYQFIKNKERFIALTSDEKDRALKEFSDPFFEYKNTKTFAQTATPLDPDRKFKRREIQDKLDISKWYRISLEEEMGWQYPIDRRLVNLSFDENWFLVWQEMFDTYAKYYSEIYEIITNYGIRERLIPSRPTLLSFSQFQVLKNEIDTFSADNSFWGRAIHRWSAMFKQQYLMRCLFQENFELACQYHFSLVDKEVEDKKFFKSKADQRVYGDNLGHLCRARFNVEIGLHPKIKALLDILRQSSSEQIIIFENYIQSISILRKYLSAAKFDSDFLIGHSHPHLQTRQQAKKTLAAFKNNDFKILIVSPIGFEGLHLPNINLGIVYSQFKTDYYQLQAEGRAGRTKIDDVIYHLLFSRFDYNQFYANQNGIHKMYSDLSDIPDKYNLYDPTYVRCNLGYRKNMFWASDLAKMSSRVIRERFLVEAVRIIKIPNSKNYQLNFKLRDKTGYVNALHYLGKYIHPAEIERRLSYYQSLLHQVVIVSGKLFNQTQPIFFAEQNSLQLVNIFIYSDQRQDIVRCPEKNICRDDY